MPSTGHVSSRHAYLEGGEAGYGHATSRTRQGNALGSMRSQVFLHCRPTCTRQLMSVKLVVTYLQSSTWNAPARYSAIAPAVPAEVSSCTGEVLEQEAV